MAIGVNKITLLGNLGKDPEIKQTSNGTSVALLRLATGESRLNKETNEWETHTEWHRVVFFGSQADNIAKLCKKGTRLYVEGKNRTRQWKNDKDETVFITEVLGNVFSVEGNIKTTDTQETSATNSHPLPTIPEAPKTETPSAPSQFEDFEDEIPF